MQKPQQSPTAAEPASRASGPGIDWSRLRRSGVFAAGVLAALLGLILFQALFPAPAALTNSEVNELIAQSMASATAPPTFSSTVYQTILPSIVFIQTRYDEGGRDENVGVGTGVIVNENSGILTAWHVVAGAQTIKVVFADGTESSAEIIAADPDNDIALLLPSRLPEVIVPAILGNPNALRIGDAAYAVGNPLGLTASMSAGVISGFNRSVPIGDNGPTLDGLIQFDTAVNPGNSGGPLLNREGQVIGIVTALANPAEQNFFSGIGFAVSILTASEAAGAPGY